MGWADPGVLEARVRRLDSEGLAAFVADLWTARGFRTTRNEASVTARRDGKTQVLYVLPSGVTRPSEPARNVDVVVAAGRPRSGETLAAELDAQFLDAADLTEMLRYAIGRDVAADLCERYFGAGPAELTSPPRERITRTVAGFDLEPVAVALVALLVVAVGAGAGFGLAGPGIGGGAPTDGAAVTTETVTDAGPDAPVTASTEGGSAPSEPDGVESVSAPGVDEAGISNASRLAQAHAATVSDTASYTIWFDYYATENGSSGQVQYDTDVRVQGQRSTVRDSLERTGGTRSLLRTVYFDGTDRYTVADGSGDRRRIDDQAPTATPQGVPFTRPAEMIRTYLATPRSSVSLADRDAAGTRYRLRGTGRPAGLPDTVTDYEMTALVDERGFVRSLEAEFSIPRSSDGDGVLGRERVRLTWTYDRLNTTRIRLPAESTPSANSSD
ncbi:hypothetical protein [Halobellus ruber]|uniref:Uncharacterized protein n=1 Tax=Halobellus ruber TaxID=2761102 RepID=A0A7J9SIU0_9EURY|nr:hypothetical protein [Halobellus ruber]MBB6646874.1 hypothetical protein [Halobellus ruber]